MALNTTTLSSAVAVTDTSIVVASATGAAAGTNVRIDDEVMLIAQSYVSGTTIPVIRGVGGTATLAHPATANVVFFLGSDETSQGAQTVTQWPIAGKARPVASYSASGAIALPAPGSDAIAVLNGTSTLTMTLAAPTKDMDGSILWIVANGKAAHTVTVSAGLGGGSTSSDVGTFSASYAGGCALMAVNGGWNLVGAGIFTATAATGAPLWA